MILYHCRHSTYKKEHDFLSFVYDQFPGIKLIDKNYDLTKMNLDRKLDIQDIIDDLNGELLLPNSKRRKLHNALSSLPKKIYVINSLSEITVDFTFEVNNQIFFLELHEKQHKNLTSNRPASVYTDTGDKIKVPRYVQRFLRDIWRIKNLPNYKIVWYDWFEINRSNFIIIFDSKFLEYYKSDSFSFSKFIKVNGGNT